MYNNPLGKKLNPRSSHRENNYFHIKTRQELAGPRRPQLSPRLGGAAPPGQKWIHLLSNKHTHAHTHTHKEGLKKYGGGGERRKKKPRAKRERGRRTRRQGVLEPLFIKNFTYINILRHFCILQGFWGVPLLSRYSLSHHKVRPSQLRLNKLFSCYFLFFPVFLSFFFFPFLLVNLLFPKKMEIGGAASSALSAPSDVFWTQKTAGRVVWRCSWESLWVFPQSERVVWSGRNSQKTLILKHLTRV